MDHFHHRFSDLFRQLGLPGETASIALFLQTHGPIDAKLKLEDAPFWSEAQSALLREEILRDADWAQVVDQLNAALRTPRPE